MSKYDEPWGPGVATEQIRMLAQNKLLNITYKMHARIRLSERGLIISDVLHVLKNGFVYAEALPATREGCFRYAIETSTPNSGGRSVRIVVIPAKIGCLLKIVTVMWIDEKASVSGSMIGEKDE